MTCRPADRRFIDPRRLQDPLFSLSAVRGRLGPILAVSMSASADDAETGRSRMSATEPQHDGYAHIPGPAPLTDPEERERFDHEMARLQEAKANPTLAALRADSVSFAELRTMEFPPLISYIEGLVLEGLTVIGGKPKLGKSWWVLGAACAIATGGVAFSNPMRKVTQAPVLYLALEDGGSRLQSRGRRIMADGESWPANLTAFFKWPRFDTGGLELLADLIDADGYKVVIIDTIGRVRSPRKGRDSYQEDTDAISAIHDLVRERPGLAVMLVHHLRKDDSPDDYVDALSGTTGIGGSADHIAVMQRPRGEADAVLHFTSRDAAEHDTAFSLDGGAWTELGDAALYAISKARREVYDVLADMEEATLTELASVAGKDPAGTLKLLRGLAGEGLAYQDGERGPWKVIPEGTDK